MSSSVVCAPKRITDNVSKLLFDNVRRKFQNFIKQRSGRGSCKVIEVSEAYTSKTCSYCGRIQNIGSKHRLICKCGVNVDRDFNGARGIFLKTFSENIDGFGGYALPEFNQVVNLSSFVRNC